MGSRVWSASRFEPAFLRVSMAASAGPVSSACSFGGSAGIGGVLDLASAP